MKRPTYFISGRSPSADVLAAELILAIREQYSRVEGIGITGPASDRTKIKSLATLEECLSLGLHGQSPEGAPEFFDSLVQKLEDLPVDVAILVGYSPLQHKLAKFFKERQVPVVLYGLTPREGWSDLPVNEITANLSYYLGMLPAPNPIIKDSSVIYRFIGCPYRDRVDKVKVSHRGLGFQEDQPIISFLPGARLDRAQQLLPFMQKLGEFLKSKIPLIQLVMPLSSFLFQKAQANLFDPKKLSRREIAGIERLCYQDFILVEGMSLEVSSLADIVVTGPGASSIEAALLKKPFVACYAESKQKAFVSMANQVAQQALGQEAHISEDPRKIGKGVLTLLKNRSAWLKASDAMEVVRTELKGLAADNAAEYIGQTVVQWDAKKRKGTRSA